MQESIDYSRLFVHSFITWNFYGFPNESADYDVHSDTEYDNKEDNIGESSILKVVGKGYTIIKIPPGKFKSYFRYVKDIEVGIREGSGV